MAPAFHTRVGAVRRHRRAATRFGRVVTSSERVGRRSVSSPLEIPVGELLELVEAAAAQGDRRAGRVLDVLIAEEQRTGELGVIARLAAKP